MPNELAHDGGLDLAGRYPASVKPVQQMRRRTQVPTSLTTGIAALAQMVGKAIKQFDACIAAQASNLRWPMKEMFEHCASPLESPGRRAERFLRFMRSPTNPLPP
ncbi:MAG: hypothetical protein BGO60_12495 [Thiobacillus sp. 65-1059]|nr:MAG: hypothetical protein BGO60_12495 [Thiobacillus sp. 65-1059]